MTWKINYSRIPRLAVGFTRSANLFGDAIRLVRGGPSAVGDKAFPNHAFLVISLGKQLFAAEEGPSGLKMNSLEKYSTDRDRIVAMYYWTGWHSPTIAQRGLDRIHYILREQGNAATRVGKYDWLGLLSFVPGVRNLVHRDPDAEWCSENVADIHAYCGAPWANDRHVAPDQLLKIMRRDPGCAAVLGYYQ